MAEVTFSTAVVRREDLLVLRFAFSNLLLNEARTHLVRLDPAQPATMTIYFPPQHLAEEAFFQDDSGGPPPGHAAASRGEGPPPPARSRS